MLSRSTLPLAALLGLLGCAACSDPDDIGPAEGAGGAGSSLTDGDTVPENDSDEVPEAPSNWSNLSSSSAPSLLRVYANSSSTNSGTNNDIQLSYVNTSGLYSCTISGGVPSGTWKSCTPTKTGTTTHAGYDRFFVAFANTSNTDGLRVSSISVTVDGVGYNVDEFDVAAVTSAACNSCNYLGKNCGTCWIDGDGNGKCTSLRVPMDLGENSSCNTP